MVAGICNGTTADDSQREHDNSSELHGSSPIPIEPDTAPGVVIEWRLQRRTFSREVRNVPFAGR
jgi:hypothetical protein